MVYLALAYGLIWLLVMLYVFRLAGEQRRLRRELDLLREADAAAEEEEAASYLLDGYPARPE